MYLTNLLLQKRAHIICQKVEIRPFSAIFANSPLTSESDYGALVVWAKNIDSGEICPNLWIRCEAKNNIWVAIAHIWAANRRCMKYQKVIQMIYLEMQIKR